MSKNKVGWSPLQNELRFRLLGDQLVDQLAGPYVVASAKLAA